MMSGIYSITVQDSLIFHCVTPGTFLQYASAGHITKSAEDRGCFGQVCTFNQTLVFGFLANPQATLEELTQTAATLGVEISPQALDQRFTAAACIGSPNGILLPLPRGRRGTSAATRRCIPRVSFFSPTKHFACILYICAV
jgi:hypothetical protein